jgi:hypothetical protein
MRVRVFALAFLAQAAGHTVHNMTYHEYAKYWNNTDNGVFMLLTDFLYHKEVEFHKTNWTKLGKHYAKTKGILIASVDCRTTKDRSSFMCKDCAKLCIHYSNLWPKSSFQTFGGLHGRCNSRHKKIHVFNPFPQAGPCVESYKELLAFTEKYVAPKHDSRRRRSHDVGDDDFAGGNVTEVVV